MTHIADAVGQLLRQTTMTIHYLPGRPEVCYRVRAPALLSQLADAVASNTSGRGGRTIPGSRITANVDALQLWHDIHLSVHTWARELDVDRRPYVAQARAAAAEVEREPAWVRTLRPWLQPVAWDEDLAEPEPVELLELVDGQAVDEPRRRRQRIDPAELPPVGQLLRITAATAVQTEAHHQVARTITRRTWCGQTITPADCEHGCWTHRIQGLLAGDVDDRDLRGAACWECRTGTTDPATGTTVFEPTTTTLIEQDGEIYRVPAIAVRVARMPYADPDDLWVYRWCRACGAEGWLPYTTASAA